MTSSRLGPVDDVAIGQDVSARGEDEPRAAPPVRPVAAGSPEPRLDVDHRRPHALRRAHHGAGVGVQEHHIIIRLRRGHRGERFSPDVAQRFHREFVKTDRACDHVMVPRLPRQPAEEVYARCEVKGKFCRIACRRPASQLDLDDLGIGIVPITTFGQDSNSRRNASTVSAWELLSAGTNQGRQEALRILGRA